MKQKQWKINQIIPSNCLLNEPWIMQCHLESDEKIIQKAWTFDHIFYLMSEKSPTPDHMQTIIQIHSEHGKKNAESICLEFKTSSYANCKRNHTHFVGPHISSTPCTFLCGLARTRINVVLIWIWIRIWITYSAWFESLSRTCVSLIC